LKAKESEEEEKVEEVEEVEEEVEAAAAEEAEEAEAAALLPRPSTAAGPTTPSLLLRPPRAPSSPPTLSRRRGPRPNS